MKSGGDAPFLDAFGIATKSVVAIVGAGGKTSLMFRLAMEARLRGCKTLVSTTTKIFNPGGDQYDWLTLSKDGISVAVPDLPGVYVAGSIVNSRKIGPLRDDVLTRQREVYDVIFLEADGAACKPLKGWKDTEPVVPEYATHTIGVVDISTIGCEVSDTLVHRLPLFTELTGAVAGDSLQPHHLAKMIVHPKGLFYRAQGRKIVYFNKVESDINRRHVMETGETLGAFDVHRGSVLRAHIL